MTGSTVLSAALDALGKGFNGSALRPGTDAYERARRVHNGLVDRRPGAILQCRGTADVVDAVRLGRELGLELAVRGGGHNVAGRAVVDDGVVIDLSQMTGMLVEPAGRTAQVQGGVTWAQFNRETQLHGLGTTGGVVGTTGVAGLTLGGGMGFLMAKHGLSADNLLSAEMVDASGNVHLASDVENPDLFWALRGGGGNFGVVTSFRFRLHRVGPMVTGGLVAHPLAAGRDLMRFYRDLTRTLRDEVVAYCGLVHAPDGSGAKLAAIVACHCGTAADGEAALRPIKEFGSPVLDAMGPIPYTAMNGLLDAAYPKGALNYWKSGFLTDLTDDAIDAMLALFEQCPASMCAVLVEHMHGAATRVPTGATAFPHRQPGYNCGVLGEWADPGQTGSCTSWVRACYDGLLPFMTAGRYVNYLGDDETAEAVAGAYGPNLQRLRAIKKRYDPDNVFHRNQNIVPA